MLIKNWKFENLEKMDNFKKKNREKIWTNWKKGKEYERPIETLEKKSGKIY